MKMIRKSAGRNHRRDLVAWPAPPGTEQADRNPDVDGPDRARRRNADQVRRRINKMQNEYKVVVSFKANTPAAPLPRSQPFRAGNPPHIMQMFDAGWAT